MAKTKYYHAANANRLIGGAIFELYDRVAGTTMGIYEATDEKEIAELDKLTKDEASAVDEITEEEFNKLRKKKASGYGNLTHLRDPSPPWSIKGKGAAKVVDGKDAAAAPADKPTKVLDNVEEALSLGRVEGEDEQDDHHKRKGKK